LLRSEFLPFFEFPIAFNDFCIIHRDQRVFTVLAIEYHFREPGVFGFEDIHPEQVFILAQTVININSNKYLFQITSGYKAVMVLRIGNTDKTVDAVSTATPRKKFEEVVNFKK